MSTVTHKAQSHAGLIAAGPIVQLLEQLERDIRVVARRLPNGETVALLRSVRNDVADALERSRRIDQFVTVAIASKVTGIPESTLGRWCRLHTKKIGATKTGGVWRILLPSLMQHMLNERPTSAQEAE